MRTDEFSFDASRSRKETGAVWELSGRGGAMALLSTTMRLAQEAARQLLEHLAHAAAAVLLIRPNRL